MKKKTNRNAIKERKQPEPQAPQNKVESKERKPLYNIQWWQVELGVGIALFFFLGIYNQEILYALQEHSLFLGTEVFWHEITHQSAGVLIGASRYLLQYCHYPVFAGLIMAIGFIGIERLERKLIPMQGLWRISLWIPILLIVLFQTSVSYSLYLYFETSVIISLELGVALSLGLTLIFDLLLKRSKTAGIITLAVLILLTFPYIGIYALLAGVLTGLKALPYNRKAGAGLLLFCVLTTIIYPYLTSRYVYFEEYGQALTAPLVGMDFLKEYVLQFLVLGSLILLFVIGPRQRESTPKENMAGAFIILLMGCVAFLSSETDFNYRTELKMKHQCEDMDWQGMLKTFKKVEEPTRTQLVYRFIALKNTHQLEEQLFDFPVRLSTKNNKIEDNTFTEEYLYASQLNEYLFRNMELWVNYGETVEELKAYALYSLLRDEKACAHKYFNLLKSTVAYRSWAKEMESYIGNRKALYAKYPLYQQIVDEQFPQNFYFTWDNLTEVYKESKVYRKEHVKTLLLLELYDQDLDRFVQDLWNMRRFVDLPLPRCFQEAVVLYSANTGHNLLKDIPVDKTVFDETCQLIQKVQTYPTADGAAKALQKEYQGNCAFYLMCTNLRLPKTEK